MCVNGTANNSESSNSNLGSKSCKSDRLGCGSSEFSTMGFIAGPRWWLTRNSLYPHELLMQI